MLVGVLQCACVLENYLKMLIFLWLNDLILLICLCAMIIMNVGNMVGFGIFYEGMLNSFFIVGTTVPGQNCCCAIEVKCYMAQLRTPACPASYIGCTFGLTYVVKAERVGKSGPRSKRKPDSLNLIWGTLFWVRDRIGEPLLVHHLSLIVGPSLGSSQVSVRALISWVEVRLSFGQVVVGSSLNHGWGELLGLL